MLGIPWGRKSLRQPSLLFSSLSSPWISPTLQETKASGVPAGLHILYFSSSSLLFTCAPVTTWRCRIAGYLWGDRRVVALGCRHPGNGHSKVLVMHCYITDHHLQYYLWKCRSHLLRDVDCSETSVSQCEAHVQFNLCLNQSITRSRDISKGYTLSQAVASGHLTSGAKTVYPDEPGDEPGAPVYKNTCPFPTGTAADSNSSWHILNKCSTTTKDEWVY